MEEQEQTPKPKREQEQKISHSVNDSEAFSFYDNDFGHVQIYPIHTFWVEGSSAKPYSIQADCDLYCWGFLLSDDTNAYCIPLFTDSDSPIILTNPIRYKQFEGCVAVFDGRERVISESGKLLSLAYDTITPLSSSHFIIKKDGRLGIVDSSDNVLLPISFNSIEEMISFKNTDVTLRKEMEERLDYLKSSKISDKRASVVSAVIFIILLVGYFFLLVYAF